MGKWSRWWGSGQDGAAPPPDDVPSDGTLLDGNELRARLKALDGQDPALLILAVEGLDQAHGTLGHDAAGALHDLVVGRLTRMLRPRDLLAQLGPNRFAVLLEGVGDAALVEAISGRIRAELGRTFEPAPGRFVRLAASVGAVHGGASDPEDSLVGNAGLALALARSSRPGAHRTFHPDQRAAAQSAMEAGPALEHALAAGDIVPWYQPLVDLETGRLVGFEALARWLPGDGRVLPPGAFIPTAEQSGLMVELDRAILRRACHDLGGWRSIPGTEKLYVTTNLSAEQFETDDLLAAVVFALEDAGLTPDRLRLELTERSLIPDDERARETLEQLAELGIQLMVDDFGTGWSSLQALAKFPISALKIDRSFIAELDDERMRRLPASILAMAETLRIVAVAEGVESREHYRILRELGCRIGQGFHFSRPRPADRIRKLLLNEVLADDTEPSAAWDLSSILEEPGPPDVL